jgi:hypothetical protein
MSILALHKVNADIVSGGQIDTRTYYFLVSPSTYINIETVTGIKKVIDTNEMNAPLVKVEELIRAGILLRLTVSGLNANKRRSYHLLTLRSRAGAVQNNLLNKIIQGTKIDSVTAQRKATFY